MMKSSDSSRLPPTLLCLDFDLTLTKSHFFRYTVDSINSGFSREKAVLQAIRLMERQGPKGGERLWLFLARWLKAGHGLVITSYTAFPELPNAMLVKGISTLRAQQASKEHIRWLSRPIIIYGDPAPRFNPPTPIPNTILISQKKLSTDDHGKNLHIEAALEQLEKRRLVFQNVLLVDDDPHNIERAQAKGFDCIQVSRDADNLEHLSKLEDYLAKE